MKVINPLLSFLLFLSTVGASAQNVMTSSPYSMFGIGEMASGLYGQNSAMGSVAYGMRGRSLINNENPAGLTGLDSCRLLAEVSAFIKHETYTSGGSSNEAFTGNLSAVQLGGRILPRWYMAASLTPYSSVGYYFQSNQPLEGSPDSYYTSTFEGTGGISKVSLSNALLLTRHLSLGVNLSYLFGNLTQTETQSTTSVARNMFAMSFYADLGVQYHRILSRDASLTLGAVYGYRQKLDMENKITITINSTDTERSQRTDRQYLPQFFGLGGSLEYKKWTYAADYTFRQYSSLSSGDSRVKFRDVSELRAGVCYFPAGYASGSYWKRMSYKAGVGISTPNMRISGNSGLSWRISGGLTLPVLNGQIHLGAFYDRLRLQDGALDRGITGFTVSYTLGETFYKVKL